MRGASSDERCSLPLDHDDRAQDAPDRDAEGNDVFQYGLPAVLQVTAQKGGTPPTVFGCGYLKLVADSTAKVQIVVQPYVEGVSGC